jgi:uncharacterized SAM-binding protein YcdF (DUF218 family)
VNELIFVLQKICLKLCFPVSVSTLLGAAGLIMWRRRALSRVCLTLAVLSLLISSFPLTGLLLLRSLESKTGPYADPRTLADAGVRYVVVLSSGFRQGNLSAADRLGLSVLRLLEGVRLWKNIPGSKLVLTGGLIPGLSTEQPIALALADMAKELGVPPDAMALETESWTTEDQAGLVSGIVGRQAFVLVTSAYHLPRSMLIFERAGLRPVPGPCDLRARKIFLSYETLIPSADGLFLTHIATQEYAATCYVAMKQWLLSGFQSPTTR